MSINKKIGLALFLIFLTQFIFSKDNLYKVLNTNDVYEYDFIDQKDTFLPYPIDDTVVELYYNMGKTFGLSIYPSEKKPFIACVQNGKTVYIPYDNLIPFQSDDLIPEQYLSKDNNDYVWIPTYYLEVVKKQDRELVRKYDPETVENYGEPHELSDGWYEYNPMEMFISNTCIDLEYGHIYNNNIKLIKDGFEVETINFRYISALHDDISHIVSFIFDGDYVSIFCDGETEPFLNYCKIKKTDFEQIKKFVHIPNLYFLPAFYGNDKEALEKFNKENAIDIDKFIWPRHADGTSDYDDEIKQPLTQPVDNTSSLETKAKKISPAQTMSVTENLKLRSAEATTSEVLTVMAAGTNVKILELGHEETIDGITSNWVKVELLAGAIDRDGNPIEKGTIGWCYGGYLEEVETAVNIQAEQEDLPVVKQATSHWLLVVLVSVGMLLLVIFIIVVVKKK